MLSAARRRVKFVKFVEFIELVERGARVALART